MRNAPITIFFLKRLRMIYVRICICVSDTHLNRYTYDNTRLYYSFLLIQLRPELNFPSFVRNSMNLRNNVVTFFYLSVISGSLENMVGRETERERKRKKRKRKQD